MPYQVETLEAFDDWCLSMPDDVQSAVLAKIEFLEDLGFYFPSRRDVPESKYRNMKKIGVAFNGHWIEVFYAIDNRGVFVVVIGGDVTGNFHAHENLVEEADRLFEEHLRGIP